MNDKKQNNDNFDSINDKIPPISTNQSRISYENLQLKRFIWITTSVILILILLSIIISLPIVMTKKKNTSHSTTITSTTAAITTEELSFTSMSNHNYRKWNLNFSIVAGGNGYGNNLNQVNSPQGIYIDDDKQTIYIADYHSHRIVGWKFGEKSGEIVAGGNGQGNKLNQLNNPSDVTVDKINDLLIICDKGNERVVQWSRQKPISSKIIIELIECVGITIDNNGDIYVSERKKHSVKRFKQGETKETIVAGGNGFGYNLNQLNNPAYIFVDKQYSIYVSENKYGRVTKWIQNAKEGIIVTKEQNPDNGQSQSSDSFGMTVDHFGNVYVSEHDTFRIVCWSVGSKESYTVMNGGSPEQPPYLFSGPAAISFDRKGNLYVVDVYAHHIMKFDVDVN
ncbi:unnamed protein product [Adineta steineri]|uniref:NHL repeat containing protein n=1 Tax=Adineta steineri TaxID=433720 RepID=A0A815V5R7_9BILA|nr:unnamed protein product [Adineta steineri]CAF1523589.1 unnamed protein product [Adineta steineri]